MGKYEVFLPIKGIGYKEIRIAGSDADRRRVEDSVFPPVFQDETGTVKMFVEALVRNRYEDAKGFISKNFADAFDLDELSDYFSANERYKCLQAVEFRPSPKNCLTQSILVKEEDRSSIIHLHMVKEPDRFGSWKIYGIEKE